MDGHDTGAATLAAAPRARQRWTRAPAWAGILAVAALLRAPSLGAAWPYFNYVDEGNLLYAVQPLVASGGWDAGYALYPTLMPTAALALERLVEGGERLALGRSDARAHAAAVPPFSPYDVFEPRELLAAARTVALLCSLALVLVTGALASALGGAKLALRAGWLAAIVPALVLRGGIASVDTMAALWVALCLLCTAWSERSPRPARTLAAAGAFAGAAFATKYPAVLVLLVPGILLLLARRPWRATVARLAALAGGAATAALLAMPALALDSTKVGAALRLQQGLYGELRSPSLWRQVFVRAEWDRPFEHPELGWLFVVLAVCGFALTLHARTSRRSAIAGGSFALALLALLLLHSFQPFRNLLPLVAPGCVLAVLALAHWDRRGEAPWASRVGIVALSLWYLPQDFGFARAQYLLRDSRREAVDWLVAHRVGGRIGIDPAIGFLPSETARLAGRVSPLPTAGSAGERGGWRFLLVGTRAAVPADVFERYDVARQFGEEPAEACAYCWRGNRARVYLLRRRPPAPPRPADRHSANADG